MTVALAGTRNYDNVSASLGYRDLISHFHITFKPKKNSPPKKTQRLLSAEKLKVYKTIIEVLVYKIHDKRGIKVILSRIWIGWYH